MKRLGTILVFKPGVTKEKVAAMLIELADAGLIDVTLTKLPLRVHEFDDKDGGPVWYLP